MRTSLLSTSLCLTTLLSLPACDPLGNDDTLAYPYCDETITEIDSLDTELPNGQTARRVLELVEGEHVMPLAYVHEADYATQVTIVGGEGSTELTLSLVGSEAPLRWIDGVEVYPSGPGPVPDIAVVCPSRLEFDAQLGFASEDGVFAELFDVSVRAELDDDGTLGLARVVQDFDPEALLGSFEVLAIEPANPTAVNHAISVEWPLEEGYVPEGGALGQPSGQVGGDAEYQDGETVSDALFVIARF